jgi:oxygen-independent coproporphyrinogen-3 oxidase
MYEYMIETLAGEGYEQYEISNFARAGFESRHNSKYWTLDPVFGFGVSSHSFDGLERYSNERDTARFVSLVSARASPEVSREAVDLASEYVFLGLRLNAGIDLDEFSRRFDRELLTEHSHGIERLLDAGLLRMEGRIMRLTRKGMLFSNEVFAEFV